MGTLHLSLASCGVWMFVYASLFFCNVEVEIEPLFFPIAGYIMTVFWHLLHPQSSAYYFLTCLVCCVWLFQCAVQHFVESLLIGLCLSLVWFRFQNWYPFETWHNVPSLLVCASLAVLFIFTFASKPEIRVTVLGWTIAILQIVVSFNWPLSTGYMTFGHERLASLFWVTLTLLGVFDISQKMIVRFVQQGVRITRRWMI